MFERAAVVQVRRDAGGPERVAANCRRQTGVAGSPLDHRQDFAAADPPVRQLAMSIERSEEGSALLTRDAGRGDVRIEVLFRAVMCRHLVELAALLVQPQPP